MQVQLLFFHKLFAKLYKMLQKQKIKKDKLKTRSGEELRKTSGAFA